MSTELQVIPDTARFTAACELQTMLPELVALSLNAKQAHWNATGPMFRPLHDITDRISQDANSWADRVAERVVALGFNVDARPDTVAAAAARFPAGHLADYEAIAELIGCLNRVIDNAAEAVDSLERADVVAHDLTVEMLEHLEKYRWMLRSQLTGHLSISARDPRVFPQDAS